MSFPVSFDFHLAEEACFPAFLTLQEGCKTQQVNRVSISSHLIFKDFKISGARLLLFNEGSHLILGSILQRSKLFRGLVVSRDA